MLVGAGYALRWARCEELWARHLAKVVLTETSDGRRRSADGHTPRNPAAEGGATCAFARQRAGHGG